MSTTVACAGNLTENPELLHVHDQKPFVSCRVLVNRRIQNEAGERVNEGPTPHNVKVDGSAATQVHDSCGLVGPIIAPDPERPDCWPDKGTCENRTHVVVVGNRLGEGGVSLRYLSARSERADRAAAQAS